MFDTIRPHLAVRLQYTGPNSEVTLIFRHITHPVDRIGLPVQFPEHSRGVQQNHYRAGEKESHVSQEKSLKENGNDRAQTQRVDRKEVRNKGTAPDTLDSESEEERNGGDIIWREQTIRIRLSMQSKNGIKLLSHSTNYETKAFGKVGTTLASTCPPPG